MMKRKQYIVDRQQYKVTAMILIYNVTAIVVTALLVFLPSFIGISASVDPVDQANAAKEILILHKRFWPAIFIVFTLVGIHSIFFFHRIFGPLYRFKETMKEVAKGDLSFNFKIRKKDFFTAEKDVINQMITSLRGIVAELKQDNELLSESIQQLESTLKDNPELPMENIREQISEIQKKRDLVSQALDKFKTS